MSAVRGWCPSAYRPMATADGLLVRVKPRLGWLSAERARRLCDLAETYGNGFIDLTSRANFQLRGVAEDAHAALLSDLVAEGLVGTEVDREARRTLVIGSGLIHEPAALDLAERIEAGVDRYPSLPPKVGVAINLGRVLNDGVPGDFRFESSLEGLILRADGAELGRPVTTETAVDALVEMMEWFLASGGSESGRMRRHIARVPLPDEWQRVKPKDTRGTPVPGRIAGGMLVGVPFGATDAAALRDLIEVSGTTHVGLTPWRLLRLAGVAQTDVPGFLTAPDPLLGVAACPGAPACGQGQVATRDVARALAGRVGSLHVSGCAKGCARQAASDVTLVGRDGRFDLVRNGCVGDTPERSGLTGAEVVELLAG